jgi:hypothetical protein
VLFPTDFTGAAVAASPYAISLAQENNAKLILLHVMRTPEQRKDNVRDEYGRNEKEQRRFELSVAEAIHQLYETVPKDADLRFRRNRPWNMGTLQIGYWR